MSTIESSQNRTQWLEKKRLRIGSSDARAILGCGYEGESEATVYDRMVFGISKQFNPSQIQLLQEGRIMEPAILEIFSYRNPQWDCYPATGLDLQVHPDYPDLCCTIDCSAVHKTTGQRIVVEAKFEPHGSYEDYQDDGVPLKHYVQVQHQLICTGLSGGYLVSLLKGNYKQRWIDRDEPLIEQMLIAYAKFMTNVQERKRPQGHPLAEYASIVASSDPKQACLLGSQASQSVREIIDLQKQLGSIESKLESLKPQVAKSAKGCSLVILDDQRVVRIGKTVFETRKGLPRGTKVIP